MNRAAIIADLTAARKERNALATEWQGVHGNAMSKAMPTRGAQGATWALSSKCCPRNHATSFARTIIWEQSNANPTSFPQQRGEHKREANTLPTSATRPSAQDFADVLGLPRKIHYRNITD